jgi:hypothetical protein
MREDLTCLEFLGVHSPAYLPELNLDVRNIFAWSHTEQLWRCSKRGTLLVKIWEEEKSKYAGLAQENGFGLPRFLT